MHFNNVYNKFCFVPILPLLQRLIFENPEGGVRKIVLATNMAETSITINDVVFVVDIGKAKETSYDALNNTPCLLPSWISKAAARQVFVIVQLSFVDFDCLRNIFSIPFEWKIVQLKGLEEYRIPKKTFAQTI